MKERRGRWQEVSQCKECGWITNTEERWMQGFFVRYCPNCGEFNSQLRFDGIFEGLAARPVRTRFGRFLRWEFKHPERVVPEKTDLTGDTE